MGFNRDIVECKVSFPASVLLRLTGFNRDIVECKDQSPITDRACAACFNRDIVECKDNVPSVLGEIDLVLIET